MCRFLWVRPYWSCRNGFWADNTVVCPGWSVLTTESCMEWATDHCLVHVSALVDCRIAAEVWYGKPGKVRISIYWYSYFEYNILTFVSWNEHQCNWTYPIRIKSSSPMGLWINSLKLDVHPVWIALFCLQQGKIWWRPVNGKEDPKTVQSWRRVGLLCELCNPRLKGLALFCAMYHA